MLEPLMRLADAAPAPARATRTTSGQRRRGVTLLELSIALAVVAVLGALAVPVVDQRMARQRLVLAAESLLGDLAEARHLAARQRGTVTVTALAGPAWRWQVLADTTAAAPMVAPTALSTTLHRAHPGVRMIHGSAVQLQGDGVAKAATVAIFESLHGERLQVDLLALGRGRICRGSPNPSPDSRTAPTNPALHRYPPC